MKKVLVIVGPTAVGKTNLSIELAKNFNGEVISGDSMQVYRSLDIGTAKATAEEMAGIPHHLLDVREISENYTAADFQKMARQAIDEIHAKGKLPIVVGGTGLYIQALLWDFQLGGEEEATDVFLRETYERYAQEHGNQALWEKLAQKDPRAAEKIHFNNRKRVIRALEVFERTGESIVAPHQAPKLLYDAFLIGLETERALLYQRIDQRVDVMMTQGLSTEARKLFITPSVQAAQGIGYKELFSYFAGQQPLDEAVEAIKRHSRRYAKRQLTWFRNRMSVHWYDLVQRPETLADIKQAISRWLKEG